MMLEVQSAQKRAISRITRGVPSSRREHHEARCGCLIRRFRFTSEFDVDGCGMRPSSMLYKSLKTVFFCYSRGNGKAVLTKLLFN